MNILSGSVSSARTRPKISSTAFRSVDGVAPASVVRPAGVSGTLTDGEAMLRDQAHHGASAAVTSFMIEAHTLARGVLTVTYAY